MESVTKNQRWFSLGTKFGPNEVQWVEKVKKLSLPIGFFHLLHRESILKQEVVVVLTPEWKFKANIARNATFEGG